MEHRVSSKVTGPLQKSFLIWRNAQKKQTATLCLTLCTCLFATIAVADEIVIICTQYQDGKTLTRYH